MLYSTSPSFYFWWRYYYITMVVCICFWIIWKITK